MLCLGDAYGLERALTNFVQLKGFADIVFPLQIPRYAVHMLALPRAVLRCYICEADAQASWTSV